MEKQKEQKEKVEEKFVEVAVLTTSGTYPTSGYNRIPSHQKVRVELEKAKKELNVVDITNWVARVGGNEINVDLSYLENNLHDQIDIDWGPRQGGGGLLYA
jgi:hypothetical protein